MKKLQKQLIMRNIIWKITNFHIIIDYINYQKEVKKMSTIFLSQEYVALVLIKGKENIFSENFITISELNQFSYYMQKEFNKNVVNVVISTGKFNREDFNIINGIITIKEENIYNLNTVPVDIYKILTDKNLIINFFKQLEEEKITKLNRMQLESGKVKRLKLNN